MDELDDLTLARAQRGDPVALEQLVRRHQDKVYAMVGRMMAGRVRRQLVDDLAQDAFLKVLKGLPRFDPRGPATLSTWILTITARTCIDAHRRSKIRPVEVEADEETALPETGDPDPEARVAGLELGRRVERAMEALPPEQRAVLLLRAYSDLDYPEIAKALELEEGTVKSRLNRARAALKRALGGE